MKKEEEFNPIGTWVKFVEHVWREFHPPKCMEQQYKKWQQLRQLKDKTVQIYTNEFHQLMARLGVREEQKLLVLKYINNLAPYIQQEMEFLTIGTIVDAFNYVKILR